MKKHRMILAVMAAALLASCSDSPADTSNANGSVNTLSVANAESLLVESSKAYSDIDAAYSAEYKKVGLPDKETLTAETPEGVFDLELEIINKNCDEEWKTKKGTELEPIFGNTDEIGSMKIKTAKLSAAYMINNSLKAEAVTPLNSDLIKSDEIITLNKKTLTSLDEKMKKAMSTAEEYNEKSKEILGDELDSIVYEANKYNGDDGEGYGVQIEKAYKNVPVLPYTAQHPIESYLDESNELYPLQGYCYFNNDVKAVLYHPENSYKAVKADRLEKIISFKGACDLLEENLGDAAHYNFEKVVLMYEPRADCSGGVDFPNIKCRPKWYFITFSEDFYANCMNCFTVDCIDGTIDAAL